MEKKLLEVGLELGLSVIGGVAFLLIAWVASIWVEKLAVRWFGGHSKFEQRSISAIARGCRVAVVALSAIVLLDALGTDIASLLAALGIFGFAIAIGLRSSLTNIFTGMFIYFLRPYTVGDYVAGERVEGIVEAVSLFHTEIATPAGILVAVPNGAMWTTRSIKNFSRIRDKRVTFNLTVDRSKSFSEIWPVIEKTALQDPDINKERDLHIRIDDVTADAMEMRVSVWCNAEHVWDVGTRLSAALEVGLKEFGIASATAAVAPPRGGKSDTATNTDHASKKPARRPPRKPTKPDTVSTVERAPTGPAEGT